MAFTHQVSFNNKVKKDLLFELDLIILLSQANASHSSRTKRMAIPPLIPRGNRPRSLSSNSSLNQPTGNP